MVHAEHWQIEVAYALPDRQVVLRLRLPPGTTLGQAIEASGILEQFPDIDLSSNRVGVFGRLGRPDDMLHDGDRVEIYRPLIADPKEVRRQRAAKGKVMKKGPGSTTG